MNTNILSRGSPFLPEITSVDIEKVVRHVRRRNIPVGPAIAAELGSVGARLVSNLLADISTLHRDYDTEKTNLIIFRIGFINPVQLILGTYSMVQTKVKRSACPEEQFKVRLAHALNQVKINSTSSHFVRSDGFLETHLPRAYDLYNFRLSDHPADFAISIFEYCKETFYDVDPYYKIGVGASALTYAQFLEYVTIILRR